MGNLDGDSGSPFPRFLTQQAVFFGFYIEYSRSVMVLSRERIKHGKTQKAKGTETKPSHHALSQRYGI